MCIRTQDYMVLIWNQNWSFRNHLAHFALCVCAVLLHSFSHFFWQTTLIDHGFFIFHFFFFPQAVRAFLSGQWDEIWHTSVEGVVIALLTNIIEINVNTVDWKNASRWAWDVRVNFILKLYFFFLWVLSKYAIKWNPKNILV